MQEKTLIKSITLRSVCSKRSIGVSFQYRVQIIPVTWYLAQCLTTYIYTHTNTGRKQKHADWDLWNGRKKLLLYDRPDMVWQGADFRFYHNMNMPARKLNRGSRNAHKFLTPQDGGKTLRHINTGKCYIFFFLKKERGNNIMPVVAHGKQHTHTKTRNRKDNLCFYKGYIATKL